MSDLCHNMLSVLGAVHLQLGSNVGKSDPTVGKADCAHLKTQIYVLMIKVFNFHDIFITAVLTTL